MSDWMDILAKPRALARRRREHKRREEMGQVYHRTRAGVGIVGQALRKR